MNDNILRIRVPSILANQLKQKASEHGRTSSDVAREGVILQLHRLERELPSSSIDNEPPQAA